MISEGSHVRAVDERGSAWRGDVGVVIDVRPDRGSALVLFEADPEPVEVELGALRLADDQATPHADELTPETKEFLSQLRGALQSLGDDALARGRAAAELHAAQVRGVASALSSTTGALVREDLHPSLATETGRFLLTVCGFEAAPPEYQALHDVPVYRLPPSDVTCKMLVPVVTAHLAQYDPEEAHPDEAVEISSPARPPTEGAGGAAPSAAAAARGRARALLRGARRSGSLAAALQALREAEAPRVPSRYRADNSQLQAASDGLQFRGSRSWDDRIMKQLLWGETVMGVDEGDGWLKVGDDAYLPFSAQGCPVLVPAGQEAAPEAPEGGAGPAEQQPAAAAEELENDEEVARAMQMSLEGSAHEGQLDQDAALATAMQQSFEEEDAAYQRPGLELSPSLLAELGATFEPQPDGSDTCAIHSLNNIVQSPRPPAEPGGAGALIAERPGERRRGSRASSASPPPAEEGPFGLKDLQRAEAEAEREALAEGFLPRQLGTPSSRNLQRAASGRGDLGASTGMFDVETVKVAARAKGYEVIDVEPVPGWSGSDAERFVEASAKAATYRSDRWFLGFLVYERIPGKAMHYYVIRRWPSKAPGEPGPWLVLDSLDRGPTASRNRLLSQDELVSFYNSNGTWFRRWLVRWYPVVDRAAAVATLRNEVGSRIQQTCGRIPEAFGHLGISERRAESTLEGAGVCWDVSLALEELLGAADLIDREVHVLRLAVSERQARQRLEAAEWDLERAVREQAERLLGGCLGEAPGSKPSQRVLFAALHMADWSAKDAARILLLHARAEEAVARDAASELAEGKLEEELAPVAPGSPMACSAEVSTEALQSAAAALEECSWDMDKALEVLRLLSKELRAEERRRSKEREDSDEAGSAKALTEADCARVLRRAGFDTRRAAQMLSVSRSHPTAPLPVCAEALRRADDCVVSARALLEEFVSRVSEVVSQAARSAAKGSGRPLGPEEAAEVARWTLEATEWNPAIAFPSAESFAVLLLQTLDELSEERRRARARANDTIHAACGQGPGAAATEEETAAALEALDKINAAEGQLTVAAVLEGLKQADMRPDLAASALWQKTTGLPARPPRRPSGGAEAAAAAPAPAAAAAPRAPSPRSAERRRSDAAPRGSAGSAGGAGGARAGKASAAGRPGKRPQKEECAVS